jgi:hypothetical protein
MLLMIDSCLCEPPSEISCFRDVTLYAKSFVFEDVLLKCPPGTRTMYWNWLKSYGAHDFIDYLITSSESQKAYTMSTCCPANIVVNKISTSNLNYIISRLNSSRQL